MVLNRLHMAAVHTVVVVDTGAVDMADRPSMDNPNTDNNNTEHIHNKAMDPALDMDLALATAVATAGDMVVGMEAVISSSSRLHPGGRVLVQWAVPHWVSAAVFLEACFLRMLLAATVVGMAGTAGMVGMAEMAVVAEMVVVTDQARGDSYWPPSLAA
jgi:hypothetical protein